MAVSAAAHLVASLLACIFVGGVSARVLCLVLGRVVCCLLQGSGLLSVFWVLLFYQIMWFANFFFHVTVGGLLQLINKALWGKSLWTHVFTSCCRGPWAHVPGPR